VLFHAPAVPAPARLEAVPFLVLAEIGADGGFSSIYR
jgi:hypothetical protein